MCQVSTMLIKCLTTGASNPGGKEACSCNLTSPQTPGLSLVRYPPSCQKDYKAVISTQDLIPYVDYRVYAFFDKNKFRLSKVDIFKLFFDVTFYPTATNRKFLYIFIFLSRSVLGVVLEGRQKSKQVKPKYSTNCSLYKCSVH